MLGWSLPFATRLKVTSLLAALVAVPALAASSPGPARRFADAIRERSGGTIAVEPREPAALDGSDPLRLGWDKFSRRPGEAWRIHLDERTGLPTLVSGRGPQWLDGFTDGEAALERLEATARAFLGEHRDLLGDWATMLELDHEASARLREGHWQLVFRQRVDGVRVENARLEFHVVRGRLVMFGASHWGRPTTNGVPALDAGEARAALDDYLGAATALYEELEPPALTLLALDAEPAPDAPGAWTGRRGEGLSHVLLWRFEFRVPGEAERWIGEIDAHDGSIVAFYDGTHYAAVRGGVFPVSNDGDCVEGGCEIAGFPMPFSDYTEHGEATTFADAFGNLGCGDPGAGFATALVGRHVRVADACGNLDEAGTCGSGADLGLKFGEGCAVQPGASAGNTAAARTSFYHLNRIAEIARFYDPGNTWLEGRVTVNVNLDSSCNAFWNGEINMYGEGNGCGNTGEQQGVLVHEWGHGYDANDGGGMDVSSEAYADVVSIFAARDSCVSRGWYSDGRTCSGYGDTCLTCTGIRDHDWAARALGTPATPAVFVNGYCPPGPGGPCGREAHCEAYPMGEAIYDLATRDLPAAGLDRDTSWQLAERLFYLTRPGSGGYMFTCLRTLSNSCGTTSWYQRMRVVDDDDGDLSNGTPHAAALHAAFARHGIACGAATNAENLSTSICPAVATPALSLLETPSGTRLGWNAIAGAGEIRVYRGDLGCDRQQVPIASLPGDRTGFLDPVADPGLPRSYRVQAFGTNPACQGAVSACLTTPPGARLQRNAHRVIENGADANGIPDPGETVLLPVTLFNGGLDGAVGVSGVLRLTDAAQGQMGDDAATWGTLAPGEAVESDAPHFELTVADSVACGTTLAFELDVTAANAPPATHPFRIPLGDGTRDFVNEVEETIPLETTAPVTSTIVVDQDKSLGELDVSVWISHGDPSELIVDLTSPQGTTVRLHDRTATGASAVDARFDLERAPDGPGGMADFVGGSTLGTWTLSIQDVGTASTSPGTLRSWTLHATVSDGFDCVQGICSAPPPSSAAGGFSVDRTGGSGESDLSFSWDPVTDAAGYRVLGSPSPAFGGDAVLVGSTAGATSLVVPDGALAPGALLFYQVRAVNACGAEGP